MAGLSNEVRNTILDWVESHRPKNPLEAKGWQYIAPRVKFTPEMWVEFLAIYGEGEYLILIESAGTHTDGKAWKRGQLLVSPQGQENMRDYVSALKEVGSAQVN